MNKFYIKNLAQSKKICYLCTEIMNNYVDQIIKGKGTKFMLVHKIVDHKLVYFIFFGTHGSRNDVYVCHVKG